MKVGFVPNLGIIVRDKICEKCDKNHEFDEYHVFSENLNRYVDINSTLIEWSEDLNKILKLSKSIEKIHNSGVLMPWSKEMKEWHDTQLKNTIPNYCAFVSKKKELKKEYKKMNSVS